MFAGCLRRANPPVWLVVWVSGRRPHSRLPQTGQVSHGVDERMSARRCGSARAWAGERTPGPPACRPAWIANGMKILQAAISRWRAAWLAFSGPRSRMTVFGALRLQRQRRVWLASGWATANGACARKPHRPPRWAKWRANTSVGLVVWVSGRRPHSRLPQIGQASHGVDERMCARRCVSARAWAGEWIPGPPACQRSQRSRDDESN